MCSGDRGGDLVEQRLEDVTVGLVDEEYAGRSLPQGTGCPKPPPTIMIRGSRAVVAELECMVNSSEVGRPC